MARGSITAPLNPAVVRGAALEALRRIPTRTPAQTAEYIRVLEEELAALRSDTT